MTEQQGRLIAAIGWLNVSMQALGRAQANLELSHEGARQRLHASMLEYAHYLADLKYELRIEQLTLERLARERGEGAPL